MPGCTIHYCTKHSKTGVSLQFKVAGAKYGNYNAPLMQTANKEVEKNMIKRQEVERCIMYQNEQFCLQAH